jgi:large conductance mechanosensitive channel
MMTVSRRLARMPSEQYHPLTKWCAARPPSRDTKKRAHSSEAPNEETAVSIASEFKEFAMKGNVVDLAVGVIIGAAFGKIVSSLVGDVFMPVLGKLIGGVNFSDMAIGLGKDPTGKDVLVKYGAFIQTIFDFVIIAFVLFATIKFINRLKKPHAPPLQVPPPPPPPKSEVLLEEIRDLLAKRA